MKPTFCWVCGRRFWGNKVYWIIGESGYVKCVHKACGKRYGYALISKVDAEKARINEEQQAMVRGNS